MRSHYKINEQTGVYFMTATIIEWIPIFTTKPYFDIIVSSFKYCQERLGLQIYAYVILDNHFHLVCQAYELSKIMQSSKRHTVKQFLNNLR
jgi:putative transposase